jgi:hypothetical protein
MASCLDLASCLRTSLRLGGVGELLGLVLPPAELMEMVTNVHTGLPREQTAALNGT